MKFKAIMIPICFLTISMGLQAQVAQDSELYKTILELDKTYFDAYNNCDMETQARLIDEDLEFYHDIAGLATSKQDIINSIKKNICGKVSRTLVEHSIEVHEINGFGAVQIGMHKFFNNQEPNAESKPSRFITIWKKNNSSWTISRVVSLHNN